MKRQFKFRAFYNGKLYKQVEHQEIPSFNNGNHYLSFGDSFLDKDCIIQQFTGLLDINGKEIYEGDILRLRITIETKGYHTSEVWRDISGAWCVNPNPKHTNGSSRALINFIKDESSCYESRFAECEIIGNIFENPELIEKK